MSKKLSTTLVMAALIISTVIVAESVVHLRQNRVWEEANAFNTLSLAVKSAIQAKSKLSHGSAPEYLESFAELDHYIQVHHPEYRHGRKPINPFPGLLKGDEYVVYEALATSADSVLVSGAKDYLRPNGVVWRFELLCNGTVRRETKGGGS